MLNQLKSARSSLLAVWLLMGTSLVGAAVSDEQASRLGQALTPVGAEAKGSDDGLIPAWSGGLTQAPEGFQPGGKLIDPFPDDKPLFVIDASNYLEHQAQLSAGQMAMFRKYPDTYRMPVYTTRRTAAYSDHLNQISKSNARQVSLTESGNGVLNYQSAVPFPIPQSGLEVIWNHILRYRGTNVARTVGQVTPQVNGDFSLVKFKEEFSFREGLKDYKPGKKDNVLFYFTQQVIEPARLAGNILLVHETIDQVKEPRQAWIYNSGQRRVRKAPEVAYDGPGTAADGLRTSDNFDLYNGSPDRYDWKLIGKQTLYIPYNSYRLESDQLKYKDIVKAGHINQDLARYELHRVWKVEATLKQGSLHEYAKRVFYIDEDTWQVSVVDHYDGRDELWRVGEAHAVIFFAENETIPWQGLEVLYDLNAGRYLALGLDNEEPKGYRFDFVRSSKDYRSQALRRMGR